MHYRKITNSSEDEIRVRSYLIWERECQPEGKSAEHWLRAKAELEAEFEAQCAASLDGKSNFVVPLLLVCPPPTRLNSVEKESEPDSALPRAA